MRFVAGAVFIWLAAPLPLAQAEALPPISGKLTYNVEWRLINAGTVMLDANATQARLKLDSTGLVSTLFKIDDTYTVQYDEPTFCATSSLLDSQEGKRHRETSVTFDRRLGRATYEQRDVLKNTVLRSEHSEAPACVHDILGAIFKLRGIPLDPGQSTQLPMSDGRRSAQVKVEAQEREEISTPAGTFKTIRYEANLLNGVIFPRKGRAFLWLTDDPRRLLVQLRLRLNFPLGSITLQLRKEEHR